MCHSVITVTSVTCHTCHMWQPHETNIMGATCDMWWVWNVTCDMDGICDSCYTWCMWHMMTDWTCDRYVTYFLQTIMTCNVWQMWIVSFDGCDIQIVFMCDLCEMWHVIHVTDVTLQLDTVPRTLHGHMVTDVMCDRCDTTDVTCSETWMWHRCDYNGCDMCHVTCDVTDARSLDFDQLFLFMYPLLVYC